MLNKIEAYKNTGVIPQKITIECVNLSIYFTTFNEIVAKLFEAVNVNDTANPYNTYNIKTYNMDYSGEALDEKDWDFLYNYQISFCEASDLNTTYTFEYTAQDSLEYMSDDISDALWEYFVYNKNYSEDDTVYPDNCPPIIITDAKFVIYPNGD